MPYKARNEAINFFNDHSSMVSEAKNKAKNKACGKGLKNINSQTIASKITDRSCTSKSR